MIWWVDRSKIRLKGLEYEDRDMRYREREAGEGDVGASSSPYALAAPKRILTLR